MDTVANVTECMRAWLYIYQEPMKQKATEKWRGTAMEKKTNCNSTVPSHTPQTSSYLLLSLDVRFTVKNKGKKPSDMAGNAVSGNRKSSAVPKGALRLLNIWASKGHQLSKQ